MSKEIEEHKLFRQLNEFLCGASKIIGAAASAGYVAFYHITPDDINKFPEPYRAFGHLAYAGLIVGSMFSLGSGVKDIAYSMLKK
jgi:hypothetical protein